jgi:hypothetical protein
MIHEVLLTSYQRLDTGILESTRMRITLFHWQFNSGDWLEVNLGPIKEQLSAPFEIYKGIFLPPGEYRFWRWRVEGQTATKRALVLYGWVRSGSYWSGHATEMDFLLTYKIAPRFQMSGEANQTFARLKEVNFVSRIFTVRVNYSLTPFITFANLIQFDNNSRNLGWQSRFRWIVKPGNDVFLVFSQGWQQDPLGGFHFAAADTKLAGKIQYTFRF